MAEPVAADGVTFATVVGLEVESVKSIVAGEQCSTINKDTRALAAAIQMATDLSQGTVIEVNDTGSWAPPSADTYPRTSPTSSAPPRIG